MEMTPAEIYDLVACWSVFNDRASEVPKKKRYSYDEALEALKD